MRFAVACLVAAVVLAGCGAGGTSETVTPADIPGTDGSATDDVANADFPPGVNADGVFGSRALADAHIEYLKGRSFTLISNRTTRYENGTLRSQLQVRVSLARDRTYHTRVSTAGPEAPLFLGQPPATAEYWSDRFTYIRAFGLNRSDPVYNEFTPQNGHIGTWQYWTRTAAFGGGTGNAGKTIEAVFESVDIEVIGQEQVNETVRVRLRATELTGDAIAPEEATAVEKVSLVATADETGLVRVARYSYEATVDGQRVTVSRVFEYSRVGETEVGRPVWYERATGGE